MLLCGGPDVAFSDKVSVLKKKCVILVVLPESAMDIVYSTYIQFVLHTRLQDISIMFYSTKYPSILIRKYLVLQMQVNISFAQNQPTYVLCDVGITKLKLI